MKRSRFPGPGKMSLMGAKREELYYLSGILIIMKLDENLKNQLIERLKPLNPEKVILFGSYAYGEPSKDSDIDLIVVTDDDIMPSNFDEKMQVYLKVSNALTDIRRSVPIDLIVHTKPMHKRFIELNSMFYREIAEKGIVLYERNN